MFRDLGDGVVAYDETHWRTDRHQPRHNSMQPRRPDEVKEFIGHHTGGATLGDPDPVQWIRNIYDYHVHGKRYSDIAYHAAIDDRGRIYALRDNGYVGGHTLANPPDGVNHNHRGYGVVLLRTQRGLTEPAKLAFRKLYGIVTVAAGWKAPIPLVHSDVSKTACPGDDLRAFFKNELLVPAPTPNGPSVVMPPTEPDFIPYPGRTLRQGDKGELVKKWQYILTYHGFNPGPADGIFGPKTHAATLTFQRARGLVPDGIVGPKTWSAAF